MRQLQITKQISNVNDDTLEKYLNEIEEIKSLSFEKEEELTEKIMLGDQEAHEKLVKANLKFAALIAKQYQNRGISLPDLINEGNLGLIRAAWLYKTTHDMRFTKYAVWRIRLPIIHAFILADYSRIVRMLPDKVSTIIKAIKFLEHKLERSPIEKEIAAETNYPLDEVKKIIKVIGDNLTLDARVTERLNQSLSDLLSNEEIPNLTESLTLYYLSLKHQHENSNSRKL